MTLALFVMLYLLGAVLMVRRFHVMIGVELSDQPGATPDVADRALWAAALWPVVVLALVCADAWIVLAHRAR